MKFKKLTIKNIASIENAVVDFTAEPLRSGDVFLISGKTGAGKSTVLDCISLALFGAVNRFSGVGDPTETVPGPDSVKRRDVRQLMRRHTGEAAATLLFTGNDGTDYEATWSVSRARRKPSGTLQTARRTLRNCSDGKVLSLARDVNAAIVAAIGMDFEQFNRTTMLAQGEFTRFLKADNSTKAQILSKLTGIDIYRRIGRKTYEVCKTRKEAYEQAAALIEERRKDLLDDDTVELFAARIAELDGEIEQAEATVKAIGQRKEWLDADARLTRQIAEAHTALDAARTAVDSDGFRADNAIVSDWKLSADARHNLSEISRLEGDDRADRATLGQKAGDCGALCAALDRERDNLAALRREQAEVSEYLDFRRNRERLYSRAAVIGESVAVMLQDLREINSRQSAMTTARDALSSKKSALGAAQKKLGELTEAESAGRLAWETAGAGLEKIGIGAMREENRALHKRAMALEQLYGAVETHLIAAESRSEAENELRRLNDSIVATDRNMPELRRLKEAADKAVSDFREIFDRQALSVDEWAGRTRALLRDGDHCPVCGALISGLGEVEESMRRLVDEQRQKLDGLRDAARKRSDDLAEAAAQRNADRAACVRIAEKLKSGRAAFEEEAARIASALASAGIETEGREAMEAVARMKTALQTRLDAHDERLREAEALEQSVVKLKTDFDRAYSARTDGEKLISEINTAIAAINARMEEAGKTVADRQEDYSARLRAIEAEAAPFSWEHVPAEGPKEFADELKAQADAYGRKAQRLTDIGGEIARKSELCDAAGADLAAALGLLGSSPAGLPRVARQANGDLRGLCAAMLEAVRSLRAAMADRSAEITRLNSEVEAFTEANPGCGRERLLELAALPPETIDDITGRLDRLRSAVTSAEAVLRSRSDERTAHSEARPDLREGETADSLAGTLAILRERHKALLEERATKRAMLERNDRLRLTLADEIRTADARILEWQRWQRLNLLIGDADGDKFQSRAQIYLLRNLIRTANRYMRRFSDRYTLRVEPNAFDILVVDAYQGGEIRSAATISGGESFLVSLALALALSGVGNNICADTLFIDEGFGTLSGEALRNAIDTLRSLHMQSGRHVGIISHVEALRESIPVQIRLEPDANASASRLTVITL